MASFIPRTHPDIYLPAIFKIWEAFNSASLDERFMELAGDLARDHVAGPESEFGSDGTAAWKDVGIWTAEQWSILTNKGLNMMGRSNYLNVSKSYLTLILIIAVPVGSLKVCLLNIHCDVSLTMDVMADIFLYSLPCR